MHPAGGAELVSQMPKQRAQHAQAHVGLEAVGHAEELLVIPALSAEDIDAAYHGVGMAARTDEPLCDYVVPMSAHSKAMMGSTDVADVSWKVPTVQARVATCAIGTPGHSWQLTAQGKSPAAHKGMVHAAMAMGIVGRMLLSDAALLERARKDHAERLAHEPYICPIPDDVRPPLQPRPAA